MNRALIGTLFQLTGIACVVAAMVVLSTGPSGTERKRQRINCVSNLKQIGVAFRLWEGDHGDAYPCNVSTNAGGARELCALDNDGFDTNAYLYLRTMTDELTTPKILVCPQDKNKKVAANFASLEPENISYRFRSGTNISESNPAEILAVCPIHGNLLLCDGSVKQATPTPPPGFWEELSDRLQYDEVLQMTVAKASVILAAGLGLFLAGKILKRKAVNPP